MTCPFGRKYNPSHVVCQSCETSRVATCGHGTKKVTRTVGTSGPATIDGFKAWAVTGKDLPSLNAWSNKRNGQWIYQGLKRTWGKLLSGASLHFGQAKGRRGMIIRRYISDKRSYYDHDNAVGGCKPIVDLLKRQGVFIDDTEEYYTLLEYDQRIGTPRIEFLVEDLI